MLEEILKDSVSPTTASNQPMFRTDLDYAELSEERKRLSKKWATLNKEEREKYASQKDFESRDGIIDLNDPSIIPAKNYSLIVAEVRARIASQDDLSLLPLDAIDFDDSVLELAESLENAPDIRDLYKLRKKTVGSTKNAGINADEAARLKNCFSQGRELYLAGRQGSLLVKPLNFFYALTAYSYGVIILNNPLRYRKGNIPGSHGMSYLPDNIQAQFGGDTARGTFSDLVTSFPTHLIKHRGMEINIDCIDSLLRFYEIRYSVGLGTLLSMIPEMSEYYKLTTKQDSRCYPLEIVNANDPRSLKWEFHIGDGEHRPPQKSIDDAFAGFPASDRHGKVVITVPASESHTIRACIYTDTRGSLWFIDNPFFPVLLPEFCVHFLITNIYSSIMRYRPDEWGNVLLNEVSSSVSLLTRHYFSSFQKKFFLLVLRCISRYIPYAS